MTDRAISRFSDQKLGGPALIERPPVTSKNISGASPYIIGFSSGFSRQFVGKEREVDSDEFFRRTALSVQVPSCSVNR